MKKAVRIILLVLLVLVVVVLAGGYIVFHNITRSPLPIHDGEMVVDGLHDRVEIFRDKWGVPHIYAKNTYDVYFAQGYTQAQDRWWQMEFFRHVASGTIEEITGKNTELLASDIIIRNYGWRRLAEQEVNALDSETLAVLQAFADGVNAYILRRDSGDLALEYGILKLTGIDVEVKPWTPVDTLIFSKLLAWQMGPQGNMEEPRSRLYDSIGQEMTEQWLTPLWPYSDIPTILRLEDLYAQDSTNSSQYVDISQVSDMDTPVAGITCPNAITGMTTNQGIGSNSWVVGGNMTESGMPLLANDPHLGLQMPSIWYEIGLHCHPSGGDAPLDVVGFAFPSAPGIIIGHNQSIAWGFTNVNPDVYDFYRIRVNPENPLQYEWNGQWRDMTVYPETIRFGDGEEPITIQVRSTHLGPIINDNQLDEETDEILGLNNEDPMAMRWTALESSTIVTAILKLNKATNWQEFRDALAHWDAPSQNIVYADTEGNIGYQMPGRIPIRSANHTGLLPVPGWTDEFEWQGFVPYEQLPSLFNPGRGYIATANEPVAPLEYFEKLAQKLGEGRNYVFSREWTNIYRTQRIDRMLNQNIPHSIDTFIDIQGDNMLLSAKELIPFLADIHFNNNEVSEARDWLLEWDCQCNMNSPHAVLYAQFWDRLIENLYTDQVEEDILVHGLDREMASTHLLMQEPYNRWWDDAATEAITETRDDILVRSFSEAYAAAVDELGKNRDKWKWGDVHTATFVSNPLGASGIWILENMVNRGPVAVSGSMETINNTVWVVPQEDFRVVWLTSMRMIVDVSDFSRSITMHTTGQSGHPYSKHYDDMIDPWRNIEYHKMLWTRQQVESESVNKLVLVPK